MGKCFYRHKYMPAFKLHLRPFFFLAVDYLKWQCKCSFLSDCTFEAGKNWKETILLKYKQCHFAKLFRSSQKADFEVSPYFSMTFLQAVSNLEKEGTSICLIAHA